MYNKVSTFTSKMNTHTDVCWRHYPPASRQSKFSVCDRFLSCEWRLFSISLPPPSSTLSCLSSPHEYQPAISSVHPTRYTPGLPCSPNPAHLQQSATLPSWLSHAKLAWGHNGVTALLSPFLFLELSHSEPIPSHALHLFWVSTLRSSLSASFLSRTFPTVSSTTILR